MTDYTLGIGGPNVMMIRDLGGWVEFWFKTGSQTWNNDQWWSWGANGTSSRQKFRLLRGGGWQLFGSVYVTYDQTIRFTIEGAGLGWATTDFYQHIQRTTVPSPPTMQSVTPISSSAFHVVFTGNYDGGSTVLEWQIGYGGSSNYPSFLVGSGGTSDVGGFVSGQKVYFWARGRNALGWSDWSNRGEGFTWRVPDPPSAVSVSEITQTSMHTQFFARGDGGVAFTDHQLGYGLSSTAPTIFVNNITGINDLTNLDPGKTYYLWARSQNSVGWSAWSSRTRVNLIAGARVLVGAEWKRAVPFVRVGGVWKVAEPWVKTAGAWKRTSA